MANPIIYLVAGFFLGLISACFLLWKFFRKKNSALEKNLLEEGEQRKNLVNQYHDAQNIIAVINEKLSQAKELRVQYEGLVQKIDHEKNENSSLKVEIARLKTESEKNIEYYNKRISDLAAVHDQMKNAFAEVSKDTLLKSSSLLNDSFKKSMEHFFVQSEKERTQNFEQLSNIVLPLKESLGKVDGKISDLEKTREGAYSGLKEQIAGLLKSQNLLQKETHTLSRALTAPTIRGRWGEMQLKRVVELSGLSAHCDFVEQASIKDKGDLIRPDMIVTLPRDKKIIIDAKAPLDSFSAKEQDENSAKDYTELVQSLRRHLLSLKKKSYFKMIDQTPEFIVMFLPGEIYLQKALSKDPDLLDFAAQNGIIIATPITLVALLKAIAFGFKQEAIADNIEDVRRLSQELIDRIAKVAEHFEKLGKSLKVANDAYNQTLASLDSRVLVTARKLSKIKSVALEKKEKDFLRVNAIEAQPKQAKLETATIGSEIGE